MRGAANRATTASGRQRGGTGRLQPGSDGSQRGTGSSGFRRPRSRSPRSGTRMGSTSPTLLPRQLQSRGGGLSASALTPLRQSVGLRSAGASAIGGHSLGGASSGRGSGGFAATTPLGVSADEDDDGYPG